MRIFITGATGFIGSPLVSELLVAGHRVLGLARSDAAAAALAAAGAEVHRGSLEDLDSLRNGAARADGVIHLGFIHDFARFAQNSEIDRLAIEALGEEVAGSDRPLIVTSGTGITPGRARTEDDPPTAPSAQMPRASEQAAAASQAKGANASVVRLAQVHDQTRQGIFSYAIEIARRTGISAYIDEGRNRIPAVHRLDAAHLFRLAVERGVAGARYHAVGEEGVSVRDVAEAIGRLLGLPVRSLPRTEGAEHFGWLGSIIGADMPASSAITQDRTGWQPVGAGLIADLDHARR